MRRLSVATLLVAGLAMAETPSAVAIRNARIITVSGPVIAKGTVVLKNGLIADVGENARIPGDAWVIDGEGLTVYPGLIDGLSTMGLGTAAPAGSAATMPTGGGRAALAAAAAPAPSGPPARGPEDRPMTTSWLKAADQVKTTDRRLELARNVGFTSAVSFPKAGIFAGQGAVINLAADRDADMVIVPSVGQYMTLASNSFGGGFPSSLFGTIAYIRQIYLDASRYTRVKEQYAANPRGLPRPEYDRALEGVLESRRILLPASNQIQISRMIRFAAELKQKTILYGMFEGYKAAAEVKASGLPVLVSLRWPEKPRDTDPDEVESLKMLELRDKAASSPAALAKAGVLFGFYSDTVDAPRDLFRAVKKAMEQGLPAADALRAMTLNVAQIYGVADRLGSIEVGKIANLVVTSGELLQERPPVKMVFIDGVKYEPTPEAPTPGGLGGGNRGANPTTPPQGGIN